MYFVDQIAHYIQEQQLPLKHLTVVVPSERIRKYLSSALFKVYGKPVLAPEIITMNRWVMSYAQYAVIDNTRALIQLFEVQLASAKTVEDKSFDEFLSWGTTLLADFNDIDRYRLDAKQVFKNLADIKEIENWSFGEDEAKLTASQKRFMEFWDRLPGYYYALNERLEKREQCYGGNAYKYLSQNIDLLFKKDKERIYLFAGFNALSPAEISIIRQVEQYGRGHILIDADEYYYKGAGHEAGMFLRKMSEKMDGKRFDFVGKKLAEKSMKVELIECAQTTGQVKVATTLLESFTKEEINETLLLLADESLISAVVKNLPKKIGQANITLGLPIKNSAMKTWSELLFSIQENRRRFKTKAMYFNDLRELWGHPFVLACLSEEEKDMLIREEREIIRKNRIFINTEHLKVGAKMQEILQIVQLDWSDNWSKAVASVRQLNRIIYEQLELTYAFERAVMEGFDKAMMEFENLVNEGIPEMSLRSFRQLFNQHWTQKSIAYHGNPMDGLQIMGVLETRGLDFKRIICLGMNEGQLPPTNPIQTMIPMDLRRYHGLPTPREKQGIFAHHFYRLLHHCEELYATYTSGEESIGSNEPSRYLMQLEMELSRQNRAVTIEKKVYALAAAKAKKVKEIPKSPEILSRLDELFEGSTSASMLKKYLTCPMDFYFRYVMDFGEAETIEEEIEHSTFGTFIHDTLEELYTPFARFNKKGEPAVPSPKNITSLDVEQMLGKYKIVLKHHFMVHFNGDENAFMKGKNLLSYQMAQELTERFLKSEIDFLSKQTEPVFIESLEREFVEEIEVEVNGEMKKVRLRGFIDRIDSIGDKIRIIDYKSGKVNTADVALRAADVTTEKIVESIGNKKHVLQLMLYAFLYARNEGHIAEPSIISFISGNNQPFILDPKKNPLDELVENFPEYVQTILSEIYDSEIPFVHQVKGQFSYCNYCE